MSEIVEQDKLNGYLITTIKLGSGGYEFNIHDENLNIVYSKEIPKNLIPENFHSANIKKFNASPSSYLE